MKYLPQKGIFAGFILNIVIVLILGWVSLKRVQNQNQLENIRQHTTEVLLELEKVQSSIYRLQNNAKGYVITKNDLYLDRFRIRTFETEKALQSLEPLFAGDEYQQKLLKELDDLADKKIKIHSRLIEFTTYKGQAEAAKYYSSTENLHMNDEVDAVVFKLVNHEQWRLENKKLETAVLEGRFKILFIVSYALAVILLVVVFFIIRHYLKERKIAESLLEGNKQLLQSIIDNTSNPVFVKTIGGEYILANRQFRTIFQNKVAELNGKTDSDIFPPDLAQKIRSNDMDVIKADKELRFEEILPHNGEAHIYIMVKFPIRDTSGKVYAIGGIATDISEQKKSEMQLMENEAMIQNIFESAPEAVIMINEKSEVMKWNKRSEQLFNWTAAEVMGKPIYDFIIPERYRQGHKSGMEHFLQTGIGPILNRTIEMKAVTKNDGEIDIELSISSNQIKGKYVFIAFVKDIRQRKGLEKENKRTNDFLDSIIENLPDMILVKDAKDLRFVRLNKAGEQLLGYGKRDLLGKNDFDFFPKEQADAFVGADKKTLESGGVLDIPEEEIDTKNGKRWLHTKKITIKDEKGNPVYLLGISEDITKRKSLEDERDHAEKELKESEKRLELILENIGEGVVVSDSNQGVLLYNQMAGEILKPKAMENFVNWTKQYNIFYPDAKTVFPAQNLPFARALRGEDVSDLELVLEDVATKRRRRVMVNGHDIRNSANKIIAAVTTIRDVTRLKEIERQLRETELKYRNLIGFKRETNGESKNAEESEAKDTEKDVSKEKTEEKKDDSVKE